jgi:hypothetical protein
LPVRLHDAAVGSNHEPSFARPGVIERPGRVVAHKNPGAVFEPDKQRRSNTTAIVKKDSVCAAAAAARRALDS